MNHPKIFCIGEAIYDVIIKDGKPVDAKVGGAMVNTAVSLGRCGLPVEYIGDTGDDKIGRLMKTFLQDNNVGIRHFTSYPGSRSRLAMAFIDDINHPEYVFYKLDSPRAPSLSYPEVKAGDIILFGSFFGIKETIRHDLIDFLRYAKETGALIIYDPNFRVNHVPLLDKVRPFILENMSVAHITKGSNDDFQLIFGAHTMEETLQHLGSNCPDIFLYTANKNGVWHHINGCNGHFGVEEIAPLSAIGAGDAFNAGLGYAAWTRGINPDNYRRIFQQKIEDILTVADDFAVDVCLTFENYVGEKIVGKYAVTGKDGDWSSVR